LLLGFFAVGCATATPVMAPNGRTALYIECPRSQLQCMEEAAESCPLGYDVIDRGGQTSAVVVAGNVAAPVHTGNLTVQCKGKRAAIE
jgi:hypothetical protein